VVILDVEMPGISAAETLEALLALSPAPRVLVVSMYDSPRLVRDLLGRGASGYLVKSASLEDLLTAVRRAARAPQGSGGENVILAVPRSVLEKVEGDDEERLSGREQEILLLAARGLSNRRISEALHISEATVKRHLANVYEKMGVGSRGEAAREALTRDWITIEEIKDPPPGTER
jgi:DNA-binding NarL/FixJ family response regulator